VKGLCPILTVNGKHRGKFNWKKYSRYSGNLRDYWVDPRRWPDHQKEIGD
jgi:hypothetical protein